MKTCPECDSTSYEKIGSITRCLICGHILDEIILLPRKSCPVPLDKNPPLSYKREVAILDKNLSINRRCTKCKKLALLKDGLCVSCWVYDRPSARQIKREERFLKRLERNKEAAQQVSKRLERKKARQEVLKARELRGELRAAKRLQKQELQKARQLWLETGTGKAIERVRGKPGAHVNKSIPTPDGIAMIDKRGVKYRVRSGRKQLGELRDCIDCGKPVFVRRYKLENPNLGKRCAPCNRKAYPPPPRTEKREPVKEYE